MPVTEQAVCQICPMPAVNQNNDKILCGGGKKKSRTVAALSL